MENKKPKKYTVPLPAKQEGEAGERPNIVNFFKSMEEAHREYGNSPNLFRYVQALDSYIDELHPTPAPAQGEFDLIESEIYKHLNSLPYEGGYPIGWEKTLAQHLAKTFALPAQGEAIKGDYLMLDTIDSDQVKVECGQDAINYVYHNYIEGNQIHPDFSSFEIYKKVGSVYVIEDGDNVTEISCKINPETEQGEAYPAAFFDWINTAGWHKNKYGWYDPSVSSTKYYTTPELYSGPYQQHLKTKEVIK